MGSIDRTLSSPNPPSGEPGTLLLETERLSIRRYLISDAPTLAAAANHPSIAIHLRDRFPSPYTLADAEGFISGQFSGTVHTRYPLHGGIFVKPRTEGNPSDEPLFIGAIGVMPGNDVDYRTWELGYWLTPSAWGKGYMTEAVRKFVRWSFETWPKLHRFEGKVFLPNEQSGRTLEKIGFVKEGLRRGANEKNGVIMGEVIYGLLRSDLGIEEQS